MIRLPRHRAAVAGGLVLVVLLAYLRALAAPFHFDDYAVVVDNPAVHGLGAWWDSLPGIRPLLKLSYAINWTLAPAPWGFHLFNVLVHAANTLLVWAVADQWRRTLLPADPGSAVGLSVALLFALHPSATEAVTYVSGRSVSLMALFYLASFWAQVEGGRRAAPAPWQAASALLFAAALAVRETAVTLPAALLLWAWFARRPLRQVLHGLRWHGAVLAAAVFAAVAAPGYDRFFKYSLGTRGLEEQLLGQTAAHAHLFLHSLVGLRTNLDPALVVPSGWGFEQVATLLLIGSAGVVAVLSRSRLPWLGFAIGWYLLQLAPSNSLLPRFDLANDRHLYLALPGAALGLSVALLRLGRAGRAALVAVVVLCGLATVGRNLDYGSELVLWQRTVADSPGKPRPWTNLGWARQTAGDLAGARAAYRCALALDPGHEQALINLSLLPDAARAEAPDPGCPRIPPAR